MIENLFQLLPELQRFNFWQCSSLSFQVESPSLEDESKLERFLVSMPKKFRKSIWVKRGDFVIITPIEEGDKVKAEIEKVLLKDSVKELKKEKAFPAVFDPNPDSSKSISDEEEEESDDDLFRNPNRPVIEMSDSDSEAEDDE